MISTRQWNVKIYKLIPDEMDPLHSKIRPIQRENRGRKIFVKPCVGGYIVHNCPAILGMGYYGTLRLGGNVLTKIQGRKKADGILLAFDGEQESIDFLAEYKEFNHKRIPTKQDLRYVRALHGFVRLRPSRRELARAAAGEDAEDDKPHVAETTPIPTQIIVQTAESRPTIERGFVRHSYSRRSITALDQLIKPPPLHAVELVVLSRYLSSAEMHSIKGVSKEWKSIAEFAIALGYQKQIGDERLQERGLLKTGLISGLRRSRRGSI